MVAAPVKTDYYHGLLVIATPEHREVFARQLNHPGADLAGLVGSRQLVFWDAQQTLNQFMVAGQPEWQPFENVARAAMRQVLPATGAEGLRAYGEMVGILWKARQFAAAIRLEQLWNSLLEQSAFSLYCAYLERATNRAEIEALHTPSLVLLEVVAGASPRHFTVASSPTALQRGSDLRFGAPESGCK